MLNNRKIKLLILIPTLECGGSENYISLLCNNINSAQFDISLVVLNNAHPFYEINKQTVEVIDLGITQVRYSLFAIKNLVKEKQPDIIYTVANHLNLLLATFRWMFPKKIRFIARESSIVSINSKQTKFPALYNKLIKKFYNRLDFILCQSVYMQRDLVSNFNIPLHKTAVIHNPVGTIKTSESKMTDKEGSSKIYQFITVARLIPEKGIDRLIKAVAKLSLPFHYDIIGEGAQRNELQNLIDQLQLQDKIFLKGEMTQPYLHLQSADLFLMGSHYEGFPNVLLEAGSIGIPVVAFDVPGGIAEIITHGENGWLVKEEKAFTEAIEQAALFKFDREKIKETTNNKYAINTIVTQTEALFTKLLANPGPSL